MDGIWRFSLLAAGLYWAAAAGSDTRSFAQAAAPAADPRPFQEFSETFKDWKLYCQVWPRTGRVECEIATRGANDRSARLVWLRSTERWLDGLRFRTETAALDIEKPVRIWVDSRIFRPEFPCRPFPFETNTCAVQDAEINRKLVERMSGGKQVSAVGQTPAGEKSEIRYSLDGFKAAVERTEEIRAATGTPWM